MAKRFRKSSRDKKIAGVCAGLADYLDMDVDQVRLFTVLLALLTSAPVIVLYILAAVFIPAATGEDSPPAMEVDWEADGLRVAWTGAIAPYAVAWFDWLAWIAGIGALLVASWTLLALIGFGLGTPAESLIATSQSLLGLTWTAALIAAMAGFLPRPWALTVTHDAVWLERPTRRARRIELSELEELSVASSSVHLMLRSGEQIRLPPPPDVQVLQVVQAEIDEGRRRSLEYKEDLARAAQDRAALDRLTEELPV